MIPPSFWNNLVTPTFFWITCNRMEEKKTLSLNSSGQLDAMRVVRRARLLVDTAVERIFSCIFLLKFDEKPLEETRRMKCWRRGVLVQFQAQPKWRRPLRLIDQAQPIRYDVVYSFFSHPRRIGYRHTLTLPLDGRLESFAKWPPEVDAWLLLSQKRNHHDH